VGRLDFLDGVVVRQELADVLRELEHFLVVGHRVAVKPPSGVPDVHVGLHLDEVGVGAVAHRGVPRRIVHVVAIDEGGANDGPGVLLLGEDVQRVDQRLPGAAVDGLDSVVEGLAVGGVDGDVELRRVTAFQHLGFRPVRDEEGRDVAVVKLLDEFREVRIEAGFAVERDSDVAGLHGLFEAFPGDLLVAAEAREEFLLKLEGGVGDGRGVVPLDVVEFVGVAGVVAPAEDAALVALDDGRHLDAPVGLDAVEDVLITFALPAQGVGRPATGLGGCVVLAVVVGVRHLLRTALGIAH